MFGMQKGHSKPLPKIEPKWDSLKRGPPKDGYSLWFPLKQLKKGGSGKEKEKKENTKTERKKKKKNDNNDRQGSARFGLRRGGDGHDPRF